MPKSWLLIFIVAYFAERTIEKVVRRIPANLLDAYDVEILIIDDGSKDATFTEGLEIGRHDGLKHGINVVKTSLQARFQKINLFMTGGSMRSAAEWPALPL